MEFYLLLGADDLLPPDGALEGVEDLEGEEGLLYW